MRVNSLFIKRWGCRVITVRAITSFIKCPEGRWLHVQTICLTKDNSRDFAPPTHTHSCPPSPCFFFFLWVSGFTKTICIMREARGAAPLCLLITQRLKNVKRETLEPFQVCSISTVLLAFSLKRVLWNTPKYSLCQRSPHSGLQLSGSLRKRQSRLGNHIVNLGMLREFLSVSLQRHKKL